MLEDIATALEAWRLDPAVHLVVIEAVGERAFCAGGDVRIIRDWAVAGERVRIEDFFVHEYTLNQTIARYPKPYIALIDGLWMGGGVGLSVHGAYRVVSEHAQFAMPEVHIGLFPDIGASYVLPRLRGAFGFYLGLTGTRVGPADALWLGLATHYVGRQALPALADALAEHGFAALTEHAEPPPQAVQFPALANRVAEIFSLRQLDAVIAALERLDDDWSRETLATMRTASPSALRWSFDLLHAGASRTLDDCLRAELALTRIATKHPDFAEGVRAMVIDKDRNPRWTAR
jgi:enoyl-CoA hydratase/carnithine racemase